MLAADLVAMGDILTVLQQPSLQETEYIQPTTNELHIVANGETVDKSHLDWHLGVGASHFFAGPITNASQKPYKRQSLVGENVLEETTVFFNVDSQLKLVVEVLGEGLLAD